MKKTAWWTLVLLLMGISQQVMGQQNIIKFNPFALALKQTSFGYERVITDNASGQLYVNYIFWDDNRNINLTGITDVIMNFGIENIDVTTELAGVRFIPSARFYALSVQQAPKGFYIEPFLDFTFSKFKATGVDGDVTANGSVDINAVMGGGTIGYQFIIKEKLSIDLFAGAEVAFFDADDISLELVNTSTNKTETLASAISLNFFAPFVPRFGVAVGYAF